MSTPLPRNAYFVAVWQLAPSLKAAAAVLGMNIRSVTRQANRLRAAGVPLKVMTEQKFNPHTKKGHDEPLSTEEQQFMAEHYELARRVSWHICRALDVPPHMLEDFVEDGAVQGLLLTARRSSRPGFVPETARGLLTTVIRRQVWALMRERLGTVRVSQCLLEGAPDRTSPDPGKEVVHREEEAGLEQLAEQARSLIGALPDTSKRRESSQTKELISLRARARQLGLPADGSVEELRERLADYYRVQLSKSTERPRHLEQEGKGSAAREVPEAVRRRLAGADDAPNRRQRQAELFVRVWETSTTAHGAAKRLGRSVRSVTAYARRLREAGVTNLRHLPTTPGPIVRSVLRLRPSQN